MKNLHFTIIILLLSINTYCQNHAFDIVLGGGYYSTPHRKPVNDGKCFNGEFEYQFAKKWAVSSGVILTRYWFRDENSSSTTLSGIPITRAGEMQYNFMAKYKIFSDKIMDFQVGTGVGITTMNREVEISDGRSFSWIYATNSDLGFPLSAELFFKPTKHLLFGLKAGSFIFPDYPIIGNNITFQTRFRL